MTAPGWGPADRQRSSRRPRRPGRPHRRGRRAVPRGRPRGRAPDHLPHPIARGRGGLGDRGDHVVGQLVGGRRIASGARCSSVRPAGRVDPHTARAHRPPRPRRAPARARPASGRRPRTAGWCPGGAGRSSRRCPSLTVPAERPRQPRRPGPVDNGQRSVATLRRHHLAADAEQPHRPVVAERQVELVGGGGDDVDVVRRLGELADLVEVKNGSTRTLRCTRIAGRSSLRRSATTCSASTRSASATSAGSRSRW